MKKFCKCGRQIKGRDASKRLLCDTCLISEYNLFKENERKRQKGKEVK